MHTIKAIDPNDLFAAGTHFGYSKSRRHPTATPFIFGAKGKSDVFDLELTAGRLSAALTKIAEVASSGKQVLFVGGKEEIKLLVKHAAEKASTPFVAGRWIGGTLTNFKQIRRRIDRMEKLIAERERGERDKYTKLERLMLDREIAELEDRFGGLADMREIPAALFVVDPTHEAIAVEEARQVGVPVIALMSSDCDFSLVQLPIPGNDAVTKSVRYVLSLAADAYASHKKAPAAKDALAHSA